MNRVLAFAGRNLKELLRDPLSYIFCLGFPLVMLVIMSIVNQSIPPEAGMTIFNIENLAGGIACSGSRSSCFSHACRSQKTAAERS